ncbi:MAG: ATP-binding protein [Acidimicrobiaceae bacterium]|nr:ATP-binding protein [Acidimicrobiaceae bacterium]
MYDALQWSRKLSEGGRERPLLFVFEEAHTYLGGTQAQPQPVQTAVQRVVKEGRKYGVGAMVVSQRPSEVDSTILSQCGTIIALRLSNARDQGHVTSAAADNLAGLLSLLPVLRNGEAIIVGEAVPLPMRALVELPRYRPESTDPSVVGDAQPGGWDRKQEESADYEDVVIRWRSQDASSKRTVADPQ